MRKRSNTRVPGAALKAALRGRTLHGYNPQDTRRALQRRSRRQKGLRGRIR